MIIYAWIQQFYFGRKQKYLWKHFYTLEKPLKNRASDGACMVFTKVLKIYSGLMKWLALMAMVAYCRQSLVKNYDHI